MIKTEFPAEKWDKKKIIMAIFILIFLAVGGIGVKTYLLDSTFSKSIGDPSLSKEIKGTSISPSPTASLPSARQIGEGVVQNLNNIQEEISKINVQELATSSPQIQKIVNDIKALPSVPGQQVKDICIKVCSGL